MAEREEQRVPGAGAGPEGQARSRSRLGRLLAAVALIGLVGFVAEDVAHVRLSPVLGAIWRVAFYGTMVLFIAQTWLASLWRALRVPTLPRTRAGRLALGGCTLTSLAIVALVVLLALLPNQANGALGLALVGVMVAGLVTAACVAPLVALHDAARMTWQESPRRE